MLFGEEHVKRYLETDGAQGHDWRGTTTLILTTTGRRSGQPRSTPLIYGTHGDEYLVVASKGGAEKHPAWYLNLDEHPDVTVQVRGDRFAARARTASSRRSGMPAPTFPRAPRSSTPPPSRPTTPSAPSPSASCTAPTCLPRSPQIGRA